MLAHLRTISPRVGCRSPASWPSQCGPCRGIFFSQVCLELPKQLVEFMEGPGKQFEKADRQRNWLGGEVPFPMNPTFRPPAPISDALRTTMYREYMKDPIANNIRELTRRYHLSMKRIDAILRLKAQEEAWLKGKPLQTGFLAGMEKFLGVQEQEQRTRQLPNTSIDSSGHNADEANSLDEDLERRHARQRYQHMYWEIVPDDGSEPVIPIVIRDLKGSKLATSNSKARTSPKSQTLIVTRHGRPTMHFVDVGTQFLDAQPRDHQRRRAAAARRAQLKARKRERSRLKS